MVKIPGVLDAFREDAWCDWTCGYWLIQQDRLTRDQEDDDLPFFKALKPRS